MTTRMRAKSAALALVALTRVALAQAQEREEAEDVTVRGSRAGGFVSEATEGEAARELTDAATLVEAMPGVHVRRQGADDGFATLSIRGSSSSQVNVLLAGVPMSGASDPSVDLGSMPLWPGARARVYRSFAPASLGQGSLGGTLVLDLPTSRMMERSEVWSAVGSFGAARLRAGDVRDLGGGAQLITALAAARADDDFSYANPLHQPPSLDPRETLTRDNSQHASASGLVGLVLPFALTGGRHGSLRITTIAQARQQHLPGTIFTLTPRQTLNMNRELMSLEATLGAGDGAVFSRLWSKREARAFVDGEATGAGAALADTTIVGAGVAAGWRGRPSSKIRVEAVVDAKAERFAPGRYVGPSPTAGATRTAVGSGVDASWDVRPSLSLSASGRVDAWHDASVDAAIAPATEVRPSAHVGAEVHLPSVAVGAHAGVLARPPNFAERFGTSGGALASPELQTESASTFDLGARWAGRAGRLRVSAEAVAFASWARELITYVLVSARGVPKAVNIGEARILGLEASLAAQLGGARLRASYTGLSTANLSACSATLCPSLPGRPARDLSADVSYALGPVTVRYGVDALAGMMADAAATIDVPARVLQSAGLRVGLGRFAVVALDVRNLFDVRTGEYAQGFNGTVATYPIGDALAFPLPGRSALASLRVTGP